MLQFHLFSVKTYSIYCFPLTLNYAVCQLQILYFRKYVVLMDEVYTVCEDWGEGSGLQLWETDCNEAQPGENNNRYTLG